MVENYGSLEAIGGNTAVSVISVANTAVSVTILPAATFSHTHVHHMSAWCDAAAAGTAQLTLNDGGTVIWASTPLIGTAFFEQTFPAAYNNPTGETNLVVTLSACGAASVGTLNVLGGNHQR